MDNINVEYSESNSNRFLIKCILVTTMILYITWILNLLDVFIIDSKIFLYAVLSVTIVALISLAIQFVLDFNKEYVKYILLFLTILIYAFINSFLTYHTMISFIFPIIFSAQYRSKRVITYTYILSTLSIIFSVVFGYYFGLCDANMLVYTKDKTSEFIKKFSYSDIIKDPDWFRNILYFAIPKSLVIMGVIPMVIHLNSVIDKRTEKLIETQNKNLKLSKEIVENQQHIIVSLASVIESRDQITGDHIKNTAKYVEFLVDKMINNKLYVDELNAEYALLVVEAAPLHDIGKIHIPDAILCKNGKLTIEEYEEMKKHPEYGFELLSNFDDTLTDVNYLGITKEVCLYHHERYDGKGYPMGLSGNHIPLCARIMAVADVLDALLSKRQYKEAYSFEKTFAILKEESGKQFDPIVLSALLDNWDEFKNNIYSKDSE